MNLREFTPPPSMMQPQARDPRLDRCKLYIFPFAAVIQLLNAEGWTVPRVQGWTVPEDEAVIIAATMANVGGQICIALTVHSPKFPIVLQQPPVVTMSGEWRQLPEGVTWDDLPHEDAPEGEG